MIVIFGTQLSNDDISSSFLLFFQNFDFFSFQGGGGGGGVGKKAKK